MAGVRRSYLYLVILSGAGYLLSFASQLLISYHFGTSISLDAYWVTLTIVNVLTLYVHPMREALVPEFHRRLDRGPEASNQYFSQAFSLILFLSLLGITISVLMPDILIAAAVSDSGTRAQAAVLLRALVPAVLLLSVSEVLNGILASYNRIVWQAAVRVLGAVSSLASIALLAGVWQIRAVVVAFLLAQVTTVAVQMVLLYRLGLRYRVTRWPQLGRKFFVVSGALLGVYACSQAYAIFEKNTFSSFSPGLISAFQYSSTLVNVLVSVIALTLSSLLWPQFLEHAANDDRQSIRRLTAHASRFLVVILGGICLFCLMEAQRIVEWIYARGAFGAESTRMTVTAFQLSIFAAIPIAVSNVIGRVQVSAQKAGAIAWTGIAGAVSGALVLFLSRMFDSEKLAMAHWLISNTVALGIAGWFYVQSLKVTRHEILAANRWVLKLLFVLALASWVFSVVEGVKATNHATLWELVTSFAIFSTIFTGLLATVGLIRIRQVIALIRSLASP